MEYESKLKNPKSSISKRSNFWHPRIRQFLIIFFVLTLAAAGLFGQITHKSSGYEQFLPKVMPQAASFTLMKTAGSTALYQAKNNVGSSIGYVTAAQGPGYGGPMSVLVGWSTQGVITSIQVPQHHEDLPWWNALTKKGFYKQYIGRSFTEPLQLSNDIDAVTGSTVSSNGVAIGVREGRLLLAEQLGKPYIGPPEPIHIGWPEILVAAGFVLVVSARTLSGVRHHGWLRVTTLIYGFIVLGVWLAIPLSLTNIASWLIGYSPHLQTFFVIYIVVFGVIGLALITGKNFYCFWLCPYVAVQEMLHFAFGGRIHPGPRWFKVLRYTRYILLYIAIILVLALKNPSVSVFEPWNVLFSLKGTTDQWALTFFALVSAIFVYNFWCHYMCPVGAVLEIVLKLRRGVINLWPKRKTVVKQETSPIYS